MRNTGYFFLVMMLIQLGCSDNHLIINNEYRNLVETRFEERKSLAENRKEELFSVFDRDLSLQQSEALKFLYAFMPLSDLADYNGDFFLMNANLALKARQEMPWGKQIPDDIFLHYVLPLRVNNENLDSFRIAYYDEIKARINSLPLKDAALEINHWCHEKVTYQGSDIRTSSPMATILSARGRCGEESTFTVAALRAAGIPARQVYTPRWAHNDDNHAWVEIWDNNQWFYMGACEPEPVFDRGWFTEPARRAMLVHTKSFGAPYGRENTINEYRNYSEVNNLSKYAVTKNIFVSVKDTAGNPVLGASVEFKLYNYAEFYTLAKVLTNEKGISRFETGLGDLLIWASKDGKYDFRKVTIAETDTVGLILNNSADKPGKIDLDLGVPVAREPYPGISAELSKMNEERINNENLIRKEYTDYWIRPEEIKQFAAERSVDTSVLKKAFTRSMGNYKEIYSFLSVVPDSLMNKALDLLDVLSDKDMRDTKASILYDHLFYCKDTRNKENRGEKDLFNRYVLNPRVANEMLIAWRSYFTSAVPEEISAAAINDPELLKKYIDNTIKIVEDENYYRTPVTSVGVHELKISDSWSRAICFVAVCRSIGIPSRLEEGRLIPQYYQKGEWHDVYFSDQQPPSESKGFIKFSSTDKNPEPEYYIHFSLARFENGRYITLEYDFNRKVGEFTDYLALPPGKYMLVTGNRISDSKILSDITFFSLNEGERKQINIKLRNAPKSKEVLGFLDINKVVAGFENSDKILARIKDKGAAIFWIDPEKEPTKHIFNDLPKLKSEFDSWGGYFIMLNGKSSAAIANINEIMKGLPSNTIFGSDSDLAILGSSVDLKTLPDDKFPYVAVVDNKGNILFRSVGYRIGIGEQILKNFR
jgi:transglutaminase-like putative cysteine protease